MDKLPKNTIVVVATGEEAKFFAHDDNYDGVHLSYMKTEEPGDLADQGPSGKTPPDMGPSEQMEATFSKILAEDLYAKSNAGKFDSLILVADPGTLGEVRPLLHQTVSDKIILELDKTLINSPVPDIEKSIASALS